MRSVLIIGAAGFLGRTLIRQCRERGVRTIGVDRPGCIPEGPDAPDVRLELDVARELDRLPEPVQLAVFAAQSAAHRADVPQVSELFRINAGGVVRTLAVLAASGGIPLLHCSTGSVYRPAWGPITETLETRQDDPYALSKLHAESMDGLFVGRVPMLNLRIFGLYGPGQRLRMVPGLAGRVRRGEPVRLARGRGGVEDGGLRISLLHVEDAAAVMLELGARLAGGERLPNTLNLASDDAPDVRQMALAMAPFVGRDPVFEFAAAREGDLIANTALLARTVETPRRSFAEGLKGTFADDPMLGES